MGKVLGIGGVSIDLLGIVEKLPNWNEIEYISEHQRQQGGMVATAMAAVSKLGGDAEFIGGVGDDEFGSYALQTFRENGIHTERVKVFSGQATSFTFIAIDVLSGEKAFFHHKGIQAQFDLQLGPIDLNGIDYLHLDGFWMDTALTVAREAKERGIIITTDISPNNRDPRTCDLFELVDYVIPSYAFAQRFTGERDPLKAANIIYDLGPKGVVVTDGEHGAYLKSADYCEHIPAFQVPVVDTTGAGDTFHGAFIRGLQQGYDLKRTTIFASAVSALKCGKIGGQAGIPTLHATQNFLKHSQNGF